MSSGSSSQAPTAKLQEHNSKSSANLATAADTPKQPAVLEEDDEFEDFPVEDWGPEDTEAAANGGSGNGHLWEESWDDETSGETESFSEALKRELDKAKGR